MSAVTLFLALALSLVAGVTRAQPATAEGSGELTLWVSPKGSDSNDGLTAQTPFKTLQHAGDWLCSGGPKCPGQGRPVVIRLAQTTINTPAGQFKMQYNSAEGEAAVTANEGIVWHYFDPKFSTTIQPWSYETGDSWAKVAAAGGYPTFDGKFTTDTGFVFVPLTALGGAGTRLKFVYTKWQRFRISGIVLSGGLSITKTSAGIKVYTPTKYTANGVTFYGNYFGQIGNYWNPKNHLAYGAVLANNSSNDVYQNNHFVKLMNRKQNSDTIHIHGLYIAHGSSGSLVEANAFQDVSGDPVRQRDRSNNTMVRKNTFTRAGAFGYFDDYYCRPSTADSYCAPKEYRSYGGVFTGNTLKGYYPVVIPGRRKVFCHDLSLGLCPATRIAVK